MFITNINASLHKRLRGLIVSVEVLKDIKNELKELRILYKELVEKLIPVEVPTSEEKRAIEEKGEIASEREMMKALGKTHVRR
jgi:archaellum component FlaC